MKIRNSTYGKGLIAGSAIIAVALFAQAPKMQRTEDVKAAVDEAYDMFKNDTGGKNADYIPALAAVDSKLYGITVVTNDNQVYSRGDTVQLFSIQSISKVFSLGLAMEELGADEVFAKIGSEATGRPFNSVPAVVDMPTHTGNPFVNAGAIATVSLLRGTPSEKWDRIM